MYVSFASYAGSTGRQLRSRIIQTLCAYEPMSPTVFREAGYRFSFFSREEPRVQVHVVSGDGEAKFWLEPAIQLAKNYNYSAQ